MKNLLRLLRTARHLKPVQVFNRIYRRLVKPRVSGDAPPPVREGLSAHSSFISRPQSLLAAREFEFLNLRKSLTFPEGWNDQKCPRLWLYNLHYFEGLLHDGTPAADKQAFIQQWLNDNPAGAGSGWEPYPISLRICNWIKWHLQDGELTSDALQSLATQVRYLEGALEYHLLGNHLLANAKALVFAALFFEGPEADRWFETGMKILAKQLPEQFLADGAHFELSTTYHTLLTEDLLDIHHLMTVTGLENEKVLATIDRALHWMQAMTRPDGALPLFNDAAYGVTPTSAGILDYATRLGLDIPKFEPVGMTDLSESGYFRFDNEAYCFIGDAGQIGPAYLPGHAHCDMLSFELSINGKPFIVDTGTSTYGTEPRRNIERSTAAHNTVEVDGQEQSEIWGEFRVGRRASIIRSNIADASARTALRSFRYSHRRDIDFGDNEIVIKDRVWSRRSELPATARFHFHPAETPVLENEAIQTKNAKLTFQGAESVALTEYQYAPEFNKLVYALCLEVTFRCQLYTSIAVRDSGDSPLVP